MMGRGILVLGAILGLAGGVGLFTFSYARGSSYLTDDPAACANCHIMSEQFQAWNRSSHRAVAVCNDCHTPAGLVPKYVTKGINGFNHSFAFTTGRFPEPIQITARNRAIARAACRKCHAELTAAIDPHPTGSPAALDCLACHRDVGHLH